MTLTSTASRARRRLRCRPHSAGRLRGRPPRPPRPPSSRCTRAFSFRQRTSGSTPTRHPSGRRSQHRASSRSRPRRLGFPKLGFDRPRCTHPCRCSRRGRRFPWTLARTTHGRRTERAPPPCRWVWLWRCRRRPCTWERAGTMRLDLSGPLLQSLTGKR
jgi:hypothetical protein